MKSLVKKLSSLLVVGSIGGGCETIKPYEKEYLLSPLMDDAAMLRMKSSLMLTGAAQFERLSSAAGLGSESSSCPTCGG